MTENWAKVCQVPFALPLRTYHFTIRQWRSAMTSVKSSVLLVLAVVLSGSGTTTLCSGENIQSGKVYKSPKHIFTIVVPKPNGFGHAWTVAYESMKGNHEMVTFYDIDYGETYRAGVAEIYKSDADLDTTAKASAVTRKHQIGLPIELVEESKVQTQFGEGSLRVYSMKGGSLLREGLIGQNRQTSQIHEKNDDDAWKKALKDQVQALLATMTLGK